MVPIISRTDQIKGLELTEQDYENLVKAGKKSISLSPQTYRLMNCQNLNESISSGAKLKSITKIINAELGQDGTMFLIHGVQRRF